MNAFLAVSFPQADILQPFAAMMLLTIVVWIYMYARRLSYMFSHGIDAQQVHSPETMAALIPETVARPANNLKNLFEMPVLFYAVCLAIYQMSAVDALYVQLAWAFVAARTLHSLVHCTFNHVMTRFTFYLLSCLALFAMIGRMILSPG